MRRFILLFSLISLSLFAYGQTDVAIVFYDECNDTIVNLKYEMWNVTDPNITKSSTNSHLTIEKSGMYIVSSGIERDNLTSLFSFIIPIEGESFSDTLEIPSISFSVSGGLHDRFWIYQNCDKKCEGTETDFYRNGNKQIEGIFVKGKPSELTTYRTDGSTEIKEFYKLETLDRTRINYYNGQGKLKEFEL